MFGATTLLLSLIGCLPELAEKSDFDSATLTLTDSAPSDTEVPGGSPDDSGPSGDSADNSDSADSADSGQTISPETCTVWLDADRDGFGTGEAMELDCADIPEGYADSDGDCDDSASGVNPDAEEICNAIDDDCDGFIDASATDADLWYFDGDSDGYGVDGVTTLACERPDGYAAYSGDCDDTDAAYNPGADESDCTDPNDYNCDGSVAFADSDGDGFAACEDCDDSDAAINPDAVEVCDGPAGGVDNNCDGVIDDDAVDRATWHRDADVDGYASPIDTLEDCDRPSGYLAPPAPGQEDCDDSDGAINPGAVESCDGEDADCDGAIDEDAADAGTWFVDTDEDGFGDPLISETACDPPDGYTDIAGDCDDASDAVHPGATERCDDADEDCDGTIDEEAVNPETFYADGDDDGYGSPLTTTSACDSPEGYTDDATDCDDTVAAINPGADEDCNGLDDDCDGTADSDAACPCYLEYNDDRPYLLCEESSSWFEAEAACDALDSYHLVVIEDGTEQSWVGGLVNYYDSGAWWWIGYHDRNATSAEEPADGWEWVNGSSSTYTNWNPDQPDDAYTEDCGHIYASSGRWNDLPCEIDNYNGTSLFYVCEASP